MFVTLRGVTATVNARDPVGLILPVPIFRESGDTVRSARVACAATSRAHNEGESGVLAAVLGGDLGEFIVG
jgi:hypothetical protein